MNILVTELVKLPQLRYMDISHNACGAPGMKEVSALIKGLSGSLKVLKMTNVGVSPVNILLNSRLAPKYLARRLSKLQVTRTNPFGSKS